MYMIRYEQAPAVPILLFSSPQAARDGAPLQGSAGGGTKVQRGGGVGVVL